MSKGKTIVIIDGYNILFSLARLEHQDKNNYYQLAMEREYFLSFLQQHLSPTKQYIIVFDGIGDIQIKKEGNLWVIFAGDEDTADEVILRLVAQEPIAGIKFRMRKVQIITDDKELRKKVRRLCSHNIQIRTGSLKIKASSH